jgi:hypothetical protein
MGHYDDARTANDDRLDQVYIERHGVTYSEYLEIGKLTKEIMDYVSIEDKGKRLSHLRSKLK